MDIKGNTTFVKSLRTSFGYQFFSTKTHQPVQRSRREIELPHNFMDNVGHEDVKGDALTPSNDFRNMLTSDWVALSW